MQSTLKTYTVCQYLTDTETKWRQEDWTAYKMVKALKGDEVKGYFDIKIAGTQYRFDNSNKNSFIKLIPGVFAKILNEEFSPGTAIVPIPNSVVTNIDSSGFKTLELARDTCLKAKGDHSAEPVLVFREVQTPSHKGGRRSPEYFEGAYLLIKKVDRPVVLIDDVCTTGATFHRRSMEVAITGDECNRRDCIWKINKTAIRKRYFSARGRVRSYKIRLGIRRIESASRSHSHECPARTSQRLVL